jgi:hypothetical protein
MYSHMRTKSILELRIRSAATKAADNKPTSNTKTSEERPLENDTTGVIESTLDDYGGRSDALGG